MAYFTTAAQHPGDVESPRYLAARHCLLILKARSDGAPDVTVQHKAPSAKQIAASVSPGPLEVCPPDRYPEKNAIITN